MGHLQVVNNDFDPQPAGRRNRQTGTLHAFQGPWNAYALCGTVVPGGGIGGGGMSGPEPWNPSDPKACKRCAAKVNT